MRLQNHNSWINHQFILILLSDSQNSLTATFVQSNIYLQSTSQKPWEIRSGNRNVFLGKSIQVTFKEFLLVTIQPHKIQMANCFEETQPELINTMMEERWACGGYKRQGL